MQHINKINQKFKFLISLFLESLIQILYIRLYLRLYFNQQKRKLIYIQKNQILSEERFQNIYQFSIEYLFLIKYQKIERNKKNVQPSVFLRLKNSCYPKQKQLLIINSMSCSWHMKTQIRILRSFHQAQEYLDQQLKTNVFYIVKKQKSPQIRQKIFLHLKYQKNNLSNKIDKRKNHRKKCFKAQKVKIYCTGFTK
ncbi:unnamed protein product [Paramecium sonneborni]|uniref:Transmembrane protein n=1 Tax=Paramecium sonneborni TaxID=65129 RepID=A0A8S1N0Q2_9CILI|nr:unnamed protein product [Paramecium sonneborni]